ncbi:MAG: hypothetical protein M3R17_01660 [Bacteroidota bacterium]|nr:hypothetical protein [Bacteroidota bacterium]
MRIFLFFVLFVTGSQNLSARKIDLNVLKNITGTKWELTGEKKFDRLFPKTNKTPLQQQLTFTTGSILFDSDDQHYECTYTLKKNKEFWLYCTQPDQYIYKIHSLSSAVLVMDMLVKTKDGKYTRKKRMTFIRKK